MKLFLVLSAKGILTKGKNDTNNCFVTIALGKEKYQTSIKDKATKNVEWREECELYVNFYSNQSQNYSLNSISKSIYYTMIISDRYRSVVTVLN